MVSVNGQEMSITDDENTDVSDDDYEGEICEIKLFVSDHCFEILSHLSIMTMLATQYSSIPT